MRALATIAAAVAVVLCALWIASSSATITGAILAGLGLVCLTLTTLRLFPATERVFVARAPGIGILTWLALAGLGLTAAFGNASEHTRREEDERVLTKLALELPMSLEDVTRALDAGQVEEARQSLESLEHDREALAKSELARRADVEVSLARVKALNDATDAAYESRAIGRVDDAVKSATATPAGIVSLTKARNELHSLPRKSGVATAKLEEVDARLHALVLLLPALGQNEAVLLAKAKGQVGELGAESARAIEGTAGTRMWAVCPGHICTALYAVAEPRAGGLSKAAVGRFLELAVGKSGDATLLSQPGEKGAAQTKTMIGTVPIHAGWFKGRLIELWAGDFHP